MIAAEVCFEAYLKRKHDIVALDGSFMMSAFKAGYYLEKRKRRCAE